MIRNKTGWKAFTLIELLVVVAIIALLVSILLPQLSRAREQARIAVCQSNMRNIAGAAVNYYMSNDDLVFSWPNKYVDKDADLGMGGNNKVFSEFIWGGDIPDGELADWDPTQGLGPINYANRGLRTDVLIFPPARRPLNLYLDSEVSWSNNERAWRPGGSLPAARVEQKSDAPGYFRCPSDKTCALPEVGEDNPPYDPDTPYMSWKNWGTSYAINWYWPYFYVDAYDGGNSDYFLKYVGGNSALNLKSRGGELLKQKTIKGAAEFILFYENQMNYAMAMSSFRLPNGEASSGSTYQYIGWHKQLNYHTAAFFDGHAEYSRFDTRFHDGPGWTTWPNREEWEKFPAFDPYVGY